MNRLRILGLGTLMVVGLLVVTAAQLPAHAVRVDPGPTATPTPGRYVQIESGDLPLVLSVPHGGDRRPSSIPDRQQAVLVNDPGSPGFAYELAAAIENRTGRRPHLILNQLHRSKLDPNRSLAQGAQGNPLAEQTWFAYHAALDQAAAAAIEQCGWGQLVDLHSHGQSGRWIELGYGLSAEDLAEQDEDLAKRRFVFRSNLRTLANQSPLTLPELVRGETSLGGLLAAAGYRVVPSPRRPQALGEYFDGGMITYLHGSRRGGGLDATQIEVPYDLLQPGQRERFIGALADALIEFMTVHYGWALDPDQGRLCPSYVDVPDGHPASWAIEALHQREAIVACEAAPRRYCPETELTRGQAAIDLWRALYPDTTPPEVDQGLLRTAEDGAGSAVMAALWREGYLDLCGVAPFRLCPDEPLTRGDLAAWALRVQQGRFYLPPRPQGQFSDAPLSEWATWWLEPAVQAGLLERCRQEPAMICPQGPVTRGELAQALALALDLR